MRVIRKVAIDFKDGDEIELERRVGPDSLLSVMLGVEAGYVFVSESQRVKELGWDLIRVRYFPSNRVHKATLTDRLEPSFSGEGLDTLAWEKED